MEYSSKIESNKINEADFDKLLYWIDADRECAAKKYLEIRKSLVRWFNSKGSASPDGLADETIDRVTKKAEWLLNHYIGDPIKYFFGVARIVFLESTRNAKFTSIPGDHPMSIQSSFSKEYRYSLLSTCLGQLSPGESGFVMEYYQGDKKEKIKGRKQMCETLGLSEQALRVRAFRIRAKLKKIIILEMKTAELNDSRLDLIRTMVLSFRKKLEQIAK